MAFSSPHANAVPSKQRTALRLLAKRRAVNRRDEHSLTQQLGVTFTFTFTFRAFSRRFYPKRLTISTFVIGSVTIHRYR